jgi:G3E family GTPase
MRSLLEDYGSNDFLRDRRETAGEGAKRTIIDLLVEQIEFADVVIINKVSEASPEQRELVRKVVMALNADARIIENDFGRAPIDDILDTNYQAKSMRSAIRYGSRSRTASLGLPGLALQVQEILKQYPFGGHSSAFAVAVVVF